MKNKKLILFELKGGNDSLNTLVNYSNPEYYNLRPTLGIPQEELHIINEDLGFHPSLKGFKDLYDAGELAIVQGAGYPKHNFSHFNNMEKYTHGAISNFLHGWIGRLLNANIDLDEYIYSHVNTYFATHSVGRGERIISKRFDHVPGSEGGLDLQPVDPSEIEAGNLLKVYEAHNAAYDLYTGVGTGIDPDLPTPYGNDQIGKQLDILHKFMATDLNIPVSKLFQTGYDTHGSQKSRHISLFNNLEKNLMMLTDEIKKMGKWEDTLILVYSEFGRTRRENGSKGTDHGSSQNLFLIGGCIDKKLFGEQPDYNLTESGRLVSPEDFRKTYNTIAKNFFEFEESFLENFGIYDGMFKGDDNGGGVLPPDPGTPPTDPIPPSGGDGETDKEEEDEDTDLKPGNPPEEGAIRSVEDLMSMKEGGNYHLADDIDCISVDNYVGADEFNGTLDGRGHSIINFKSGNTGIVRDLGEDGVIKDLSISGEIVAGTVRGLVANISRGRIEGVAAEGAVSGRDYLGGIIGEAKDTSVIEGCISHVDMSGRNYVGGVAGINTRGRISECTVGKHEEEGVSIEGNSYVGGIVGEHREGLIERSTAIVEIRGSHNTGGIVGRSYGSIQEVYAHVDLKNTGNNAGGICGVQNGKESEGIYLRDAYSTGRVESGDRAGGVVGNNSGLMESVYSSAYVTGKLICGGVVGRCQDEGKIFNALALGEVASLSGRSERVVGEVNTLSEIEYIYYHLEMQGGDLVEGAGAEEVSTKELKERDWYMENLRFVEEVWNLEKLDEGRFPSLKGAEGETPELPADGTPLPPDEGTAPTDPIPPSDGDGGTDKEEEEEDTDLEIGIRSVEELMAIEESKSYYLANDIDCSGVNDYQRVPLFKGVLDGKGCKVYNFFSTVGGIFHNLEGTVKNLEIEGEINSTLTGKGAVANLSNGTIENVVFRGKIGNTSRKGRTAGIVGSALEGAKIRDCKVDLILDAPGINVGPIAGVIEENVTIKDCKVIKLVKM